MKVQYFSVAVALALASTVATKPVPENGETNTVPVSWSDVESGSQNAQRAAQGQAQKRSPGQSAAELGNSPVNNPGARDKHKDKATENANLAADAGKADDHANDPTWGKRKRSPWGNTAPGDPAASAAVDPNQAAQATAPAGTEAGAGAGAGAGTGAAGTTAGGVCVGAGSGCVGDVTHWDGGLGACGWDVPTDSAMQIALPVGLMGAQSNDNPYCGKSLTIKNPTTGATAQATVGDKCMGCQGYSIDLTNALFNTIASNCDGRCSGFEWWFN